MGFSLPVPCQLCGYTNTFGPLRTARRLALLRLEQVSSGLGVQHQYRAVGDVHRNHIFTRIDVEGHLAASATAHRDLNRILDGAFRQPVRQR
ncbi:hypothetical protein D3C80_1961600 [compost metagenome]